VRTTKLARPFAIDAWVVLPEHMHAVWMLPTGNADYSSTNAYQTAGNAISRYALKDSVIELR